MAEQQLDILQGYVNDMLAVEKEIHQAFSHQKHDQKPQKFPAAGQLIARIEDTIDRHIEELAVDTFARSLQEAAADYLRDPLGHGLIPNWNRVIAASPNFFDLLLEAVELDAGVMQPAVV